MERKRKRSQQPPLFHDPTSTSKQCSQGSQKMFQSPPKRQRKRENANVEIQTDEDSDFQFLFSDQVGDDYWKELAETRRVALSEALEINLKLIQRVKELEEDNGHLEEIVADAKKLASLISNADNSNNESGIEKEG